VKHQENAGKENNFSEIENKLELLKSECERLCRYIDDFNAAV
jgi:hypothetical protein